MVFPDTAPRFGSDGVRFQSHLNTNGHFSTISYGHTYSTAFRNAHSYTISNTHSSTGRNS